MPKKEQPFAASPHTEMTERAADFFAAAPEEAAASGGIVDALKRAAVTIGELINDWSDGRYGLAPPKLEKKALKAQKKAQQGRLLGPATKEAERTSGVRWLPWTIGLSLGLVVGLVGVAYWQRRRLQRLWGETSQRVQEATEHVRQHFEANRSPFPRTMLRDITPERPNATPLESPPPGADLDRQRNGRLESANPEGRR